MANRFKQKGSNCAPLILQEELPVFCHVTEHKHISGWRDKPCYFGNNDFFIKLHNECELPHEASPNLLFQSA